MKDRMTIKGFAAEKGYDSRWLKNLSFASILIGANELQTLFTKTLKDITSKQWLMLTILKSLDEMPTLSDMGELMGCSRQNVKQIAKILKDKGYIRFAKYEDDKNTVRLAVTEKWIKYREDNLDEIMEVFDEIFEGFTDEEVKNYFEAYVKLMDNMKKINMKRL